MKLILYVCPAKILYWPKRDLFIVGIAVSDAAVATIKKKQKKFSFIEIDLNSLHSIVGKPPMLSLF